MTLPPGSPRSRSRFCRTWNQPFVASPYGGKRRTARRRRPQIAEESAQKREVRDVSLAELWSSWHPPHDLPQRRRSSFTAFIARPSHPRPQPARAAGETAAHADPPRVPSPVTPARTLTPPFAARDDHAVVLGAGAQDHHLGRGPLQQPDQVVAGEALRCRSPRRRRRRGRTPLRRAGGRGRGGRCGRARSGRRRGRPWRPRVVRSPPASPSPGRLPWGSGSRAAGSSAPGRGRRASGSRPRRGRGGGRRRRRGARSRCR